jgi:hypothetical protein
MDDAAQVRYAAPLAVCSANWLWEQEALPSPGCQLGLDSRRPTGIGLAPGYAGRILASTA